MQIQGKVTSVVASGGYQSQNGYIYNFQMGIQTPNGAYAGEIGSKSQTYPVGVGQEIIVETKETPHGTKFKKINPGYQNQGQQQGQNQQSSQKKAPPTNESVSIQRQCAVKSACNRYSGVDVSDHQVETVILRYNRFMETGNFSQDTKIPTGNSDGLLDRPASMDGQSPTHTPPANPNYVGDNPPMDGDIPF